MKSEGGYPACQHARGKVEPLYVRDLGMHLSDALTVVTTAQQRYAGEAVEFLGVLDLIAFKLQEVRENHEALSKRLIVNS